MFRADIMIALTFDQITSSEVIALLVESKRLLSFDSSSFSLYVNDNSGYIVMDAGSDYCLCVKKGSVKVSFYSTVKNAEFLADSLAFASKDAIYQWIQGIESDCPAYAGAQGYIAPYSKV